MLFNDCLVQASCESRQSTVTVEPAEYSIASSKFTTARADLLIRQVLIAVVREDLESVTLLRQVWYVALRLLVQAEEHQGKHGCASRYEKLSA